MSSVYTWFIAQLIADAAGSKTRIKKVGGRPFTVGGQNATLVTRTPAGNPRGMSEPKVELEVDEDGVCRVTSLTTTPVSVNNINVLQGREDSELVVPSDREIELVIGSGRTMSTFYLYSEKADEGTPAKRARVEAAEPAGAGAAAEPAPVPAMPAPAMPAPAAVAAVNIPAITQREMNIAEMAWRTVRDLGEIPARYAAAIFVQPPAPKTRDVIFVTETRAAGVFSFGRNVPETGNEVDFDMPERITRGAMEGPAFSARSVEITLEPHPAHPDRFKAVFLGRNALRINGVNLVTGQEAHVGPDDLIELYNTVAGKEVFMYTVHIARAVPAELARVERAAPRVHETLEVESDDTSAVGSTLTWDA